MLALVILEGVVVAMLAFLVVGLLKSHGEILRQLHDLGVGENDPEPGGERPIGLRPAAPAGQQAHDLVGQTPSGEAVAIGVAGAAHDTLLAFLSSGCATCTEFWDAFATPDRLGLPPRTRLVVVTRGPEAESVTAIGEVAPAAATVVMSSAGWESYRVPGSPYFVLVDGPAGAVVGDGTGTSWIQVQSLMRHARGDRADRGDRQAGGDRQTWGARGDRQAGGDRGAQTNGSDRQRRTDRGRMDTDDAELLAAGIGPGHASLFAPQPSPPPASQPATAATPAAPTDT